MLTFELAGAHRRPQAANYGTWPSNDPKREVGRPPSHLKDGVPIQVLWYSGIMVLWTGSCRASVCLRPRYRNTLKPEYLNSYKMA